NRWSCARPDDVRRGDGADGPRPCRGGLLQFRVRLSARSISHTPGGSLWVQVQVLPHVHRPSPSLPRLGSPLVPCGCPLGLTSRRGRVRVMLRTVRLLAPLSG